MKLTYVRPLLRTRHMDATIQFYTEVLGFILAEKNEEWEWASLYRDEVGLMLGGENAHFPFTVPHFTGSFYFSCSDVNALWTQINDKVEICYAPEDFPWGMREFGIFDNNGYLLQFGQEISTLS